MDTGNSCYFFDERNDFLAPRSPVGYVARPDRLDGQALDLFGRGRRPHASHDELTSPSLSRRPGARVRGTSLAHEGYISIFCREVDPFCGVVHYSIKPQKVQEIVQKV